MKLLQRLWIMEKQLNYLSRLETLIGDEAIQTLGDKSVFVLGVGGVGGYVCEALARSGIGKFILMDADLVDVTNINRQVIALRSTVGRYKVDVMKERILDINPDCQVEVYPYFLTEDNLSILDSSQYDFFIDACDTVSTKKCVLSFCKEKGIPFLTCLGTAKKFQPNLLEITDLSKTYNDPLARILRKYVKDNHISGHIPVLFSSEVPCKVKELGSTAFVPSSAGILIASYVVRKFIDDIKKDS